MSRRRVSRRDKKIFQKTARKTKSINCAMSRGGIRL